ncbi:MAG: T9SS type A sorting domain-containing protein [Saprospiraceae bacterium]
MKTTLISLLFYSCTLTIQAQCYITYDYDPAGNRIIRYDCNTVDPWQENSLKKDTKELVMNANISPEEQGEIFKQLQSPDDEIKLFPNPSNGLLEIKSNGFESADISVYNLQGELLLKYLRTTNFIDLSMVAKGHYLIVFKQNNKIASQIVTLF